MKLIDIDEFNTYHYIIPKRLRCFYDIDEDSFIPESCKKCSNYPSNGGSGICHCILGTSKIY
jgi:hypothetical protein